MDERAGFPLAELTTLRLGGPAERLLEPGDENELIAAVREGMVGFHGSAGLSLSAIEEQIHQIKAEVRDAGNWGANLIANVDHPEKEMETVDLFLRLGVRRVSASAFLKLTPAVVKLAAVLAVGLFAVFSVAGGPREAFAALDPASLRLDQGFGARWMTLLFLSATAAICLPRQFQVTVVENSDESHLATASWLFPLYMLLMSLFVLPLAAVGGSLLPAAANPDLFMLLIPLQVGRE